MEVKGTEAIEARLSESISEPSISGKTELSETLSAIQKEIPREIINERVGIALQDPVFRNEILEATENAVIEIDTVNQHLEGSVHPVTEIPFERKEVVIDEGIKVSVVIPDFSEYCRFDPQLPEDLHKATDYEQAKYCNEQLSQAYENGSLDTEQFTDRQREQIRNGDKPEGYTWHHHEEPGRIQLVPSDIHDKTAHTGGRSLWGGGSEAR